MSSTEGTAVFDVQAADEAVGARPETAVRLLELAKDEETTPLQLEQVIDSDPSMAARILKQANSAFYGMRSRISRIDRAIAMLGVGTIAKIAASSSVASSFRGIKIEGVDMPLDTVWRFSMSVAHASEVVVAECTTASSVADRRLAAEAFVAGLIHDIGILVQAKTSAEKFAGAVKASLGTGIPLVQQERRWVGIDHAEIGMRLGQHWGLPAELVHGIGFHHDPLSAALDHRTLACMLHVTGQLSRRAGVPSYDGDTDMSLLEPAMDHLRIAPVRADRIVTAIRNRLKDVEF